SGPWPWRRRRGWPTPGWRRFGRRCVPRLHPRATRALEPPAFRRRGRPPRTRPGDRRRLAWYPMRGARRPVGRALLAAALLVGGLLVTLTEPAVADGTPPPNAFILVDAGTG